MERDLQMGMLRNTVVRLASALVLYFEKLA